MIITTPSYLFTVISDEATAEHLIPNLLNFDIEAYTSQKMQGGAKAIPGTVKETGDIIRTEFYCTRGNINALFSYFKTNYSGKYPVHAVLTDVGMPV